MSLECDDAIEYNSEMNQVHIYECFQWEEWRASACACVRVEIDLLYTEQFLVFVLKLIPEQVTHSDTAP